MNRTVGMYAYAPDENESDYCSICGQFKKMSYEHVPPRSAFNKCPAVQVPAVQLIGKNPLTDYRSQKGKYRQQGIGAYTLCKKCNSTTGGWYGTAYAEFAKQGMEYLKPTEKPTLLYYPFRIYPLRVIKQVVCMFLSVRDVEIGRDHQEVVKFVLDRDRRYLNPEIRIFAYLNLGGHGRFMGSVGRSEINPNGLTVHDAEAMQSAANRAFSEGRVMSEVSLRPLGFLMSFDSKPPDVRLVDISYFSRYGYNESHAMQLKLPALPVWTMYPGDYRTLEEIERAAAQSGDSQKAN